MSNRQRTEAIIKLKQESSEPVSVVPKTFYIRITHPNEKKNILMILVDTSQTWMVKSKSVSDLDFADWTWSNKEIHPSKCWLQMYPWQQDEWGNILSLIHSGADQKNRPHSVQCHQFIHQKHSVNMARLFQWEPVDCQRSQVWWETSPSTQGTRRSKSKLSPSPSPASPSPSHY